MSYSRIIAAVAAAFLGAGLAPAARAQTASKAPAPAGGIQWFTRLKDGLAEAKRTGKPILFLSAAPSCGGVPGVW
jgi:ABC-type sugar transport system substrate-binding protein